MANEGTQAVARQFHAGRLEEGELNDQGGPKVECDAVYTDPDALGQSCPSEQVCISCLGLP
jgi:hypothetical protein